jgi:type VI secretion system protein ImpA
VTAERVGFEQAVAFKALGPLVERITEFLQEAVAKRDPTLAPPPDAAGGEAACEAAASSGAPPGTFASLSDVDCALGAALGYFAASEPSSPALLLIGQARETLGKNLYEVMKLLAPNHADAARVFVGPESAFTVPVSGLSGAPSLELARADASPAPSRAAALALIDSVASHMRRVEPSSPAPYLLDRAKALASRDFLSLLHDVLPEDNLNTMRDGR